MSFAENLKWTRKRAGVSQAALAERIRVLGRTPDRSYIAKLETGTIDPRLATVGALARALRVPVWLLVSDVGEGDGRWLAHYLDLSPAQKREVQRLVRYYREGGHT